MSKLGVAAAATGVGGTGAAGTYAAYHYGVFGGGEKGAEQAATAAPEQVSVPQSVSPPVGRTIEEFKKNGGKCFESGAGVFDDWLPNGKIGETTNLTSLANADEFQLDKTSDAKGCLEYSWKLGTGEDKWKGSSFLFVWALSQGKSGFSVFLSATGADSKALELEGIIYFFEKDDKGWKTTKKLEMKETMKTLSTDQIKNVFPKRDPNVIGSSVNEYWDFFNDAGDNIKGGSDEEGQVFKFTSSKDGTKKANEWSSNSYDWHPNLFDSSKCNLIHLANEIKGSWSK